MNERNDNSIVVKIILVIVGLIIIVLIANTCAPGGDNDAPLPSGEGNKPAPTTQIKPPDIKTKKTDKKPDEYLTATEMKDWSAVVAHFRVAVGANSKTKDQWLTDVQPYVTPEVYRQLDTVGEENMLHGIPVGQPRGVRHGDNYVVFEDSWEEPDSWEGRYMVQKVGGKWLISSYQLNPNTGKTK